MDVSEKNFEESIEARLLANGYIKRTTEQFDKEVGRINELMLKLQESIAMLCEYRTALISAAVTGKTNVRGEVKL